MADPRCHWRAGFGALDVRCWMFSVGCSFLAHVLPPAMDALGVAGGAAADRHPFAEAVALQDRAVGGDDLLAEGEPGGDAAREDSTIPPARLSRARAAVSHLGDGATAHGRMDRRGGGWYAGSRDDPARSIREHGGAWGRWCGEQTGARAGIARASGEAESRQPFCLPRERSSTADGSRRRRRTRSHATRQAN